jgi:tetratricopeptide (TPR) repeat protein
MNIVKNTNTILNICHLSRFRIAAILLISILTVPMNNGIGALRAQQESSVECGSSNECYNQALGRMQRMESRLRNGHLNQNDKLDVALAEKEFLAAIEMSGGTHGRAYIMLGMLYNFTNRYEEAIEPLKMGMTLPPGSEDWLIAANTLVNVYFNQNRPKPALPILTEIIKYDPEDARAHYKLGLCYMFTGRKKAAIEMFGKSLELDPTDKDARQELDKLKRK